MNKRLKAESRSRLPQAAAFETFELDIDVLNTQISDYIHTGSGCPLIVSGLGPI